MKKRAWIAFLAVLIWTSTAGAAQFPPVEMYSDKNITVYADKNELQSAPTISGYMDRRAFSVTLSYYFKTDQARNGMITAAKQITQNYKTFVMVPNTEDTIAFVNYEVRFYHEIDAALVLKETFLDSTGQIIAWRNVGEVAFLTGDHSPILAEVFKNLGAYITVFVAKNQVN